MEELRVYKTRMNQVPGSSKTLKGSLDGLAMFIGLLV